MTKQARYNKVHKLIMQGEYAQLQELIDNGNAWRLEGSYGRAASEALDDGYCVLGATQQRDYYGSIVPAYYQVQAGTKGSVENAERQYTQEAVTV